MNWQELYHRVLQEIAPARLVDIAETLRRRNVRQCFSGFAENATWLTEALRGGGLEAQCTTYPADGETRIGDRILPLAWDVEAARLDLVAADGTETTLAAYPESPYSIVMFAGATPGVIEAPLRFYEPRAAAADGACPNANLDPANFAGACVFTELRPSRTLAETLMGLGAVALVFDGNGPATAHYRRAPHATRWINDAFGEGMISRYRRTVPAFSITPDRGRKLRERLQAGDPLQVRCRVNSRTYDGDFHIVRARLPGRVRPQENFLLLAHLFEPNMINNCSGVAALTEGLGALKRLTARGEVPVPARTLELFSSWEMFGVAAAGIRDPALRLNGVGGLALDCLLRKDSDASRERIAAFPTPDAAPSFINGLLFHALEDLAAEAGIPYRETAGFTSNDNMLSDPTLGPPVAMLNGTLLFEDGSYHTDADTADKLDWERLAHVAAASVALAWVVADATAPENATALAELAAQRAGQRLAHIAARCDRGELDCAPTRLRHVADIEAAAVRSVTRLCSQPAVHRCTEHLCRDLAAQARELCRHVGGSTPTVANQTLWNEAAQLVPERTIPGPFSCQDAPGTLQQAFRDRVGTPIASLEWSGAAPTIFWVDGQRSLARISELSQLQQPALRDDQALLRLRSLFTFLAENGYMRMACRNTATEKGEA